MLWTASSELLGMTIGFRLAETDIGQFALEEVGEPVVRRGRLAAAIGGEVGKARVLTFEVVQNILKAFFDPPEIAGAVIGGSFQPF